MARFCLSIGWLLIVGLRCAPASDPTATAPANPHLAEPLPEFTDSDREHWAFQPLSSATPPLMEAAADRDWVRMPIDAFILAKLRESNLSPSTQADRRTLIRRVTFDLTGLPPTPDEIDAFLAETSFETAWQGVIDRLLASPRYGEQWGRHWLDVVRFGESEGFEYDRTMPGAWMFRDYVVHALNADKPYDRFILEQLAGDELAGPATIAGVSEISFDRPDCEQRVAAGFHRLGPVRRNAGNPLVAFSRNEVLTEETNIIGTAFLALSVGCARCHDHMFDPIRQSDYYRLQAFLADTYAVDLPLTDERTWQEWKQQTDAIQSKIDKLTDEVSQAADQEEIRIKDEIKALKATLPEALPTLFSVRQQPAQRSNIHLLKRGDEDKPGALLGMRPLGVLLPDDAPELSSDAEHPKTNLARWIADPANPLTARVMVNRIWQYHFGTGLVSTSNDFGLNGGSPTHPELLDWLAAEFIRGGWSVKHLHRVILTSATYLQAGESQWNSSIAQKARGLQPSGTIGEKVDPENRLLWSFPRRRLDAEELRDSMLAVSGRLNGDLGGASIIPPVDPDLVSLLYDQEQWQVTPDPRQHDRRSIYLIAKRNLRLPFLEVFDQPDLQTSCARRQQSTHAPQALELLNGPFANDLAQSLAARLTADCGDDDRRALVTRAYALAAGREPTAKEMQLSLEFLSHEPVSEFALAVLNLNSFLYVD